MSFEVNWPAFLKLTPLTDDLLLILKIIVTVAYIIWKDSTGTATAQALAYWVQQETNWARLYYY